MRLGGFELNEPLPELNEPHALAVVRPWVNVSNAGTLTLSRLESYFSPVALAELSNPADFFDFTRYRPTAYFKEGRRELLIPNSTVTYARREDDHDFVFLRLDEPHMMSGAYIESVLDLLKVLGVKRYCLFGSMYEMVPYTRPLLVTGSASSRELQKELEAARVVPTSYEGPTTILYLIGQKLQELGAETLSLVVHLPNYLAMKDDYRGEKRLMEVFRSLYGLELSQGDIDKARKQEEQISLIAEQLMQEEPRYKLVLAQLEASYDSRVREGEGEEEVQLSPEVENFLQEMNRRFGQG